MMWIVHILRKHDKIGIKIRIIIKKKIKILKIENTKQSQIQIIIMGNNIIKWE